MWTDSLIHVLGPSGSLSIHCCLRPVNHMVLLNSVIGKSGLVVFWKAGCVLTSGKSYFGLGVHWIPTKWTYLLLSTDCWKGFVERVNSKCDLSPVSSITDHTGLTGKNWLDCRSICSYFQFKKPCLPVCLCRWSGTWKSRVHLFVCAGRVGRGKAVFTCLFVQVEWDVEKPCFETFARETADFCAVKAKWLSSSTDDETEQQVVVL